MSIEALPSAKLGREQALLRLHSWLSPSFPIGAYTYSHALEHVIDSGDLKTRDDLVARIHGILRYGSGWNDGLLLRQVLEAPDMDAVIELAQQAYALRGAYELGFEAAQQGEAFIHTVQKVWPLAELKMLKDKADRQGYEPVWPIAYGVAVRAIGAPHLESVNLFLLAFVHNLVSAAVRAVPLGQTDGQLAIAALESEVMAMTQDLFDATPDDLGGCAIAQDIASMNHETQYTRIFRS